MDDVDALLKEEKDTREINSLLAEAGAPPPASPPAGPSQEDVRRFSLASDPVAPPMDRPLSVQGMPPLPTRMPKTATEGQFPGRPHLPPPGQGVLEHPIPRAAGAFLRAGAEAAEAIPGGIGTSLGHLSVLASPPEGVALPGPKIGPFMREQMPTGPRQAALDPGEVLETAAQNLLLATPLARAGSLAARAGGVAMGALGIKTMAEQIPAALEAKSAEDVGRVGAGFLGGALMQRGGAHLGRPGPNAGVKLAPPGDQPFVGLQDMLNERKAQRLGEEATWTAENEARATPAPPSQEQMLGDLTSSLEQRHRANQAEIAQLRDLEAAGRRMEGENFDRTVQALQGESAAAQGAEATQRTDPRLLSDIERAMRAREAAVPARQATELEARARELERARLATLKTTAGQPLSEAAIASRMPPVPPEGIQAPPEYGDLPFGMPPLGPKGTYLSPEAIAQSLEASRPQIPLPPIEGFGTAEATGMPMAARGQFHRLMTEKPTPIEGPGMRQMIEEAAPKEVPPEAEVPPRAPARAGAAAESAAGPARVIPDVQLREKLAMVAPVGGLVERTRARHGNPAAEGNWFSRSNIPQAHAEAKVWADELRREIPARAWGDVGFLDDFEELADRNPIASEVAMNLREGKPLSAQEQSFYQANRSMVDRFLEGSAKVLREADESGVFGGSLGPNYFPWEVPNKVGYRLALPSESYAVGRTKWRHEQTRLLTTRPQGMNAGTVMKNYVNDLAEAIPQKPLEANLFQLRDQHLAAGNGSAAIRINEYLKHNVKGEMPPWEKEARDAALAPYRNKPVTVGLEFDNPGGLGRPGRYRVVKETPAGYQVTVNGEVDPVFLTQGDINAMRFQDTIPSTSSKMALVKVALSHNFVSWNPASMIRAAVTNVPRVAARLDVRDYGVAMNAVRRWATQGASKAEIAEWTEAGALEGSGSMDMLETGVKGRRSSFASDRSPYEMLKAGWDYYRSAAFAGVVIPDKMARIALYEGAKARLGRLYPDLTQQQIRARARVEMGIASDISGDLYRAPGETDVASAVKFLQNSSIRTAEQAWDILASGNVPAGMKGAIAAIAAAYPVLKAAGGTWEDLQDLVLGSIPFYGALSGRAVGAPAMALESVGKLAGAGKYALDTGMAPPLSEVPILTGAQRLLRAGDVGARALFPVRLEKWEKGPEEMARQKIKRRFDQAEKKTPKERLP